MPWKYSNWKLLFFSLLPLSPFSADHVLCEIFVTPAVPYPMHIAPWKIKYMKITILFHANKFCRGVEGLRVQVIVLLPNTHLYRAWHYWISAGGWLGKAVLQCCSVLSSTCNHLISALTTPILTVPHSHANIGISWSSANYFAVNSTVCNNSFLIIAFRHQ